MGAAEEAGDSIVIGRGCGWPAALVVIVLLVAMFGFDWFRDWLEDRDDARLDDLRETTVEVCGEHTESSKSLCECVADALAATGQPS